MEIMSLLPHYRVYQVSNDDKGGVDVTDEVMGVHLTTTTHHTSRVLTELEKYRKAFTLTQDLAKQLSTCGMKDLKIVSRTCNF